MFYSISEGSGCYQKGEKNGWDEGVVTEKCQFGARQPEKVVQEYGHSEGKADCYCLKGQAESSH